MGTYLLALDQGHHRGAGHPPGPPGLAGVYGVTAGEHSSPLRLGCCFVSHVGAAFMAARGRPQGSPYGGWTMRGRPPVGVRIWSRLKPPRRAGACPRRRVRST